MIRPLIEESTWCYWVVSVGALLSFLGLVVACICSCRRNENKNEFLGLAGSVTINDSDNDGFNRVPVTNATQVTTQDAVESGKRSTSANRSLPDIPKDREKKVENTDASVSQSIYETTETIGDQSELYATVRDTAAKERISKEEIQEISHQRPLIQENSTDQYSRFTSPNSDTVEHPYAQLQNVQKTEVNQSNRNNVKQIPIDAEQPSTSTCQVGNGNPVAPPRTRRSSSHNSLLTNETATYDIQAANAISGGVQANQDLPYMTPPLSMLLPQSSQPRSNSPQQHFSGDSQDSKGYTSISVREPLANIIAQTKTICRQNQSIRPLTDPHYATVSDDSDEMYAAIDEQDKIYTSGSETYAQIQPTMTEVQRVTQNEQTLFSRAPSRTEETYSAPQPPSVDSLRHVAHAHSRQASSSSANSSIVNPASPKPEKRQANSPLPPPPPSEGTMETYASIEKRTKNEDRLKSTLSNEKSLEDMYAKVMKKKKDAEEQQSEHACPHSILLPSEIVAPAGTFRKPSLVEINRISSSSHDSIEVQKKESDSAHYSATSNNSISSFHSEVVLLKSPRSSDIADIKSYGIDHGYEAVAIDLLKTNPTTIREPRDPNYETLRSQEYSAKSVDYHQSGSSAAIGVRNGTDLPTAYTVPFKQPRQASNASSEDPGYEKVRLRKRRIDVDQDTDSEPNYESMPHDSGEPNYASVCRPGDSDTDPNYESVNHGDPNYESVKYMSVARTNEEPPYEQVNSYKTEHLDGYEKVRKQLSNADYERIYQDHSMDLIDNGDTDDEQYVQV
ncbi:uncharacterized protein LOC100877980 isoform X1 [Megachile rotundata]|uniref:uncharacterized protein LOC100877980 isoform X1 n=1 Tax=Megachile rotundata TaxID=143995 RepID=UPI000258D7CE|nr:PREDICTED: uncharacterized protein LOC100877980 isoform X1 [Megachile rotundata]